MDRRLIGRAVAIAFVAATIAGGAHAAGAAPPPANVDEVVVFAAHDPALGATYPASGETVAPGLLVLKVAFTVAMAPERWSYAPVAGAAYPQCLPRPRLLADRKTFVLLCSVAGQSDYAVELNAGTGAGFVGAGGRRAPDYTLRFRTSDATTVASLALAMTAAALKDDESPLMGAGEPAAPRTAAR